MNRIFHFIVLFFATHSLFASWNPVNIGNNDKLNAVYFFNTNLGVIAGDHGIYYTSTGGTTAGAWLRYTTFQSTADSLLYEKCHFYKVASRLGNKAYFCGEDTVAHTAVILYINSSTLTASFVYTGAAGTRLNDINFNYSLSVLYAVGDNGLFVRSDLTAYTEIPTGTTARLNGIWPKSAGKIEIAGDHVYLRGDETGTVVNFTENFSQPYDMLAVSGSSFSILASFGTGASFYTINSSLVSNNTNYDFGPLNGRDILYTNSILYTATSHGIFVSTNACTDMEYMPSSGSNALNDIFFLGTTGTNGYSVGDHGIFLYTSDGGGARKPYCNITVEPHCSGDNNVLSGYKGSATNCQWLVNGSQISTFCAPSYVFPSAGIYNLTYITGNSYSLYDTATSAVTVVEPPLLNFHAMLSDSILCKNGTVDVQIDSTQTDFMYGLRKYVNPNSFGTVSGTGASALLHSYTIDSTGNYYLQLQSSISPGCIKISPDTFAVLVEETKSLFHSAFINADTNENTCYFAHSRDASYYDWTFTQGANLRNSTLQNPAGISFPDTGYVNVRLISTSVNGCADTLYAMGPYIVDEPAGEDTCWVDYTDGSDPPWTGSSVESITAFHVLPDDSYLTVGECRDQLFRSRYGVNYGRLGGNGGYIAKYSTNESLKWLVYSIPGVKVLDVTADSTGNIYYLSSTGPNPTIRTHFNDGDSLWLFISSTAANPGSIVKLDSIGRHLWHRQLDNGTMQRLKTDHAGNIIITGTFAGALTWRTPSASTVLFNVAASGSTMHNFILKISPAGNVIWATYFYNYTDFSYINDFDVDGANNIYFSGSYTMISFHSANGTPTQTMNTGSPTLPNAYLVKLNANGNYQWKASAKTTAVSTAANFRCVRTSASGDCFIAGNNGVRFPGEYMVLTDASGALDTLPVAGLVFLSVNRNGLYKWAYGSADAYGGAYVMAMKGDKLALMGGFNDPAGSTTWTGNLVSANGLQNFSITDRDFFLSEYDTLGNLHWIAKAGNVTPNSYHLSPRQLEFTSGGYLQFFGQGGYPTSLIESDVFGTHLYFNREDSFIGKTGEQPCGGSVLVLPLTTEDVSLQQTGIVKAWPNPYTHELSLSVSENDAFLEISMYDLLGRCVLKKAGSGTSMKLDSELPAAKGIYLLRYLTKKGAGTVIVECN